MRLRPVTQEDSERLLKWRNLPEVRRYMYTDHIITQEEHDRWFGGMLNDTKGRCYLIFEYDEKPVGMVGFTGLNNPHGTADFAYYLGEPVPKGTGQEMEKLSIKYAFEELKIRKLSCEVLDFNERVIHIHKKYGFEEEGIFKRHIVKNGKEYDVHRFGMVAPNKY